MALQVIFFGPENIYDPTESFAAVSNRLIVSPIVRKLVYNKVCEVHALMHFLKFVMLPGYRFRLSRVLEDSLLGY